MPASVCSQIFMSPLLLSAPPPRLLTLFLIALFPSRSSSVRLLPMCLFSSPLSACFVAKRQMINIIKSEMQSDVIDCAPEISAPFKHTVRSGTIKRHDGDKEKRRQDENPDYLALLITNIYNIWTFCYINPANVQLTVTTLAAKYTENVQMFCCYVPFHCANVPFWSKAWSYACSWLLPWSLTHIACFIFILLISTLSVTLCSVSTTLTCFFFFLKLTRFHAQPAKAPCVLCLWPHLWQLVGIMWGNAWYQKKAARYKSCTYI